MRVSKEDDHWFVVQTHACSEDKAAFNLRRQGFEAFTPKYLKRRSHARKIEMVGAPLFPRYLFVKMSIITANWRAIKSTLGVSNLVCFGENPASVPDGLIETLMTSEDELGYIDLAGRREKFKKGQGVEIVDGPMMDMTAVFDCMNDKDRVVVLLDILGRQVRACVPLKDIRSLA